MTVICRYNGLGALATEAILKELGKNSDLHVLELEGNDVFPQAQAEIQAMLLANEDAFLARGCRAYFDVYDCPKLAGAASAADL